VQRQQIETRLRDANVRLDAADDRRELRKKASACCKRRGLAKEQLTLRSGKWW